MYKKNWACNLKKAEAVTISCKSCNFCCLFSFHKCRTMTISLVKKKTREPKLSLYDFSSMFWNDNEQLV